MKGETCVCCDCEGFHPCTASSGAKETPIQPKPMAGHGPGGCASVQGRRARPRRTDDLYASAPRIRPRSLISLTSPGDVSVSRRRQPRGAEPGRPSTRLGRAPAPDPRDADELPARAENTGASPITCLFARDARAERASSGQRHVCSRDENENENVSRIIFEILSTFKIKRK